MKNKIIIISAKIVLLIACLWQVGIIPGLFQHSASSEDEEWNYEVDTKRHQALNKLIDSIKSQPQTHNAEGYFKTLAYIKEQKLDKVSLGMTAINELQEICNLRQASEEEIVNARNAYEEKISPGSIQKREERRKQFDEAGGFLGVLARTYLKLLPIAFVLFLVWRYENCPNKKKLFVNPISFMISLVFYPLVILILILAVWAKTSREIRAEIDVRRTKEKLFSLLSDNELGAIKKFASSKISLTEFRLKQFGTAKVEFKHNFAIGLLVVVITLLIPLNSFAKSNFSLTSKTITACIVVLSDNHSPPGNSSSDQCCIIENVVAFYQALLYLISDELQRALCAGYTPKIIHIPWNKVAYQNR